jgi:hypothetical protein
MAPVDWMISGRPTTASAFGVSFSEKPSASAGRPERQGERGAGGERRADAGRIAVADRVSDALTEGRKRAGDIGRSTSLSVIPSGSAGWLLRCAWRRLVHVYLLAILRTARRQAVRPLREWSLRHERFARLTALWMQPRTSFGASSARQLLMLRRIWVGMAAAGDGVVGRG